MPCKRPSLELIDLPAGWLPAVVHAIKGQGPGCSKPVMFGKRLKPVERCPHCQLDWFGQQAVDFPTYIGIVMVGHVLAPVVIAMIGSWGISAWVTLAIMLAVTVVMLIAIFLQPSKGAVIGLLWWHGIGAFRQERRRGKQDL